MDVTEQMIAMLLTATAAALAPVLLGLATRAAVRAFRDRRGGGGPRDRWSGLEEARWRDCRQRSLEAAVAERRREAWREEAL